MMQRLANNRFHGVLSLSLVGCAIVLVVPVMFSEAWLLGVAYLVVCAGATAAIVVAYCAKCPCKGHCGHVLPGLIARRIKRQPGPYTRAELVALLIALALILLLPQIWLWQYPGLFVAFWALAGIGLVEIRAFVCRACDNIFCPLKRSRPAA